MLIYIRPFSVARTLLFQSNLLPDLHKKSNLISGGIAKLLAQEKLDKSLNKGSSEHA
jgi:hypothetical protein